MYPCATTVGYSERSNHGYDLQYHQCAIWAHLGCCMHKFHIYHGQDGGQYLVYEVYLPLNQDGVPSHQVTQPLAGNVR